MSTSLPQRSGDWIGAIVAGLLFLLLPGPGAWAQGPGLHGEDTRPGRSYPGRAIVVHDGRLSVDVQAADLGEVLTQIGRQASIHISLGPSAGKRVSAQFADVELEEGLRRLLRLASLSHMFLYAPGPAGTVAIAEVRVVGEGQDTTPHPTAGAEPGAPAGGSLAGTPGRKALRQARMREVLPMGAPEPEVSTPAPDDVGSAPEPTPDPGQAEPSEAMRRVLDAFTRSKRMGASPPDGQEASPPEPQPPSDAPGDVRGGF